MNEVFRGPAPICEISSETTITGRRPIKLVLHEIHPDREHYQENGISWNEVYTRSNMNSVIGMSIVAEFLSDERDMPYGHGMTDIKDDMPLFEDATMVGHFDNAYVDDVFIDGEMRRVLVAEGTLDEMRYPKFVEWLRKEMAQSEVRGSVEIVGKPENGNQILYDGGWREKGRIPQSYDYSGYAILSIRAADSAAVVMELNQSQTKEEERQMDEKTLNELKEAVVDAASKAVTETNSKNQELLDQIGELNATIQKMRGEAEEKDRTISELNERAEQLKAQVEEHEQKVAEVNTKLEEMEKQKAIGELNAALSEYTEEQQDIAKDEISAFRENPGSVEINSIIGKICTGMVRKAREANPSPAAEIDVFSMTDDPADHETDIDIF